MGTLATGASVGVVVFVRVVCNVEGGTICVEGEGVGWRGIGGDRTVLGTVGRVATGGKFCVATGVKVGGLGEVKDGEVKGTLDITVSVGVEALEVRRVEADERGV